jgi:hypothetical protein
VLSILLLEKYSCLLKNVLNIKRDLGESKRSYIEKLHKYTAQTDKQTRWNML